MTFKSQQECGDNNFELTVNSTCGQGQSFSLVKSDTCSATLNFIGDAACKDFSLEIQELRQRFLTRLSYPMILFGSLYAVIGTKLYRRITSIIAALTTVGLVLFTFLRTYIDGADNNWYSNYKKQSSNEYTSMFLGFALFGLFIYCIYIMSDASKVVVTHIARYFALSILVMPIFSLVGLDEDSELLNEVLIVLIYGFISHKLIKARGVKPLFIE